MTENTIKWAVIEIGGKQHLVSAGAKIQTNQLPTKVGESLKLKSLLDELPVTLEVVSHELGEKIRGLKFKNKVRYIRRYGHRQPLTTLAVVAIGEQKKTEASAAPKKEEKAKTTAPVKKTAAKVPAKARTTKKASVK